MYKAFFCDLDNTLLNKDKLISNENIEAIKYAEKRDCKFLVCTGRLPFCINMFKEQLNLKDAVTTNGCIVYKDGKKIKDEYLKYEDTKAILDYGIKHNEYERIFVEDYLYLLHIEKGQEDAHFYKESKGISEEEAYRIIKENKIYKMSFFGDHEHMTKIKKDLEKLDLDIEIVFSGNKLLECIKKGESKAKGVIDYCKASKIDIKDTIGAGDNENDLEMLRVVGLSACPCNSTNEIKEICDYICDSDCNNSCIKEIVEYIIK